MALTAPFCSACLKDLAVFDLVLTSACRHLYCSDCIHRFERCPIDAIAWGRLEKHNALITAFETFHRNPEVGNMRQMFALVNTKDVMCKFMGTRTHLRSNCPYRHTPPALETWDCDVCGLENENNGSSCAYCAAPHPRTPRFLEYNLLPERVSQPAVYWLCPNCRFENNQGSSNCWGCEQPRPATVPIPQNCAICGESRYDQRPCSCVQIRKIAPGQVTTRTRTPVRSGRIGSRSPTPKARLTSPAPQSNSSPQLSTPHSVIQETQPPRSHFRSQTSGTTSQTSKPPAMDLPIVVTLCALLGLLLYALLTR